MKRITILPACLLFFTAAAGELRGATTNETPNFKELYELLRANLTGMDEAALNRAAVQGLLTQLHPHVTLITEAVPSNGAAVSGAEVRPAVFDGAYGYVGIRQIGAGIDRRVLAALEQLKSTNRLKGLVLDLRFAGGQDYAAAAALADWFFPAEKPLLDWGEGLKKATAKNDAVALPLAVLVNRQTTGAAEAFAGILREGEVGLLIGATTAGQAGIAKEFTLAGGQRLRLTTAPVKVGNGRPLPTSGLEPDLRVEVSAKDELAYFEDAYKVMPKPATLAAAGNSEGTATNRPPRRRINEAELVRMLREGQDPEAEATVARDPEPAKPVVRDPALARALDLLKGLAVVRHFRAF